MARPRSACVVNRSDKPTRRVPAHPVILGSESSVFRLRFEPILNAEVSAEIGGVPPVSQTLRWPSDDSISVRIGLPMNPHSPDFVTVDMRGLKAALVARAQAQRVSVSVLVRAAVARHLGLADGEEAHHVTAAANVSSTARVVKLSIRMNVGGSRPTRCQCAFSRPVAWCVFGRARCGRTSTNHGHQPPRPHRDADRLQRRTLHPQPQHPSLDVVASTRCRAPRARVPRHARYAGR
jgi:hypothetical protein